MSELLAIHLSTSRATLFVDDGPRGDSIVHLADFKDKIAPDEMWRCRGDGALDLVVLSAPRDARELYRVLASAGRLVAPGGAILILPTADDHRVEATEVFLGVHRNWSRRMLEAGVLELRNNTGAVERLSKALGRAVRNQYSWGCVDCGATVADTRTQPKLHKSGCPYAPEQEVDAAPKKRVVSLSIFGDSRFADDFWRRMPEYAVNYVIAHRALFPGWELRVHHDEHLYHANGGDALLGLARRGLVKLVYAPSHPGQGKCERMLHRLAPAWDPEVEIVICRDVDSLPTWRDRCAVEEWVASGLDAHTIHDSVSHAGMMGGLCGFRAEALRRIAPSSTIGDLLDDRDWSKHGADQDFLNGKIAPHVTVLEHSLYKMVDDGGAPVAKPSIEYRGRTVATEIAAPARTVVGSVEAVDRERSDALVGHMGSSGYDLEQAEAHYGRDAASMGAVNSARRTFKQHAVIACDLNTDYSFYLPVVCRAWASRGYRPLLMLVGEPRAWLDGDPRHKLEVDRAREADAVVEWIGDFENVRTSTIAQVSRIYAALLPGVSPDDYLITSDADMLPIGDWVGRRDESMDLHIWYANAYAGSDYPHWPMCYVGARASVWREIVIPPSRAGLSFREALEADLALAPADADGAWNYDERLLGEMISRWPGYPDRAQLIQRNFTEGEWRVDRSAWSETLNKMAGSLAGVADAHLPRPGYDDLNWPRIAPVLALAMPDHFEWLNEYRNLWIQSDPCLTCAA